MATRTELKEYMSDSWFSNSDEKRVYSCKAWYKRNDDGWVILKSYATLVACYSNKTNTVYGLNYFSATTCQHIHKFANLMNARKIVWLYPTSRCSKKWAEKMYDCDYAELIEDLPR